MADSPVSVIGPVAIIGGLALVIWLAIRLSRTGEMAEVSISAKTIEIRPRWPLPILSFRALIVVPSHCLTDVTVEPGAREFHQLSLRVMGLSIPGALTTGTFRGEEGLSFWLYGNGKNALTLEIANYKYQLIVIEVADPASVARELRALLNAR